MRAIHPARILSVTAICCVGLFGANAFSTLAQAPTTHPLLGRVTTPAGRPVEGVSIEFSGGICGVVTGASGMFSITAPESRAEIAVTPRKAGYLFAPASARVWLSEGNAEANFVARAQATPQRATTPDAGASLRAVALDAFEPDDTTSAAKAISSGLPQTHSIHVAGNSDWAKFALSENSDVVIETSGSSSDDTVLYLYGPNSSTALVEWDDNDGDDSHARIERTRALGSLLPAGTYYCRAAGRSTTTTIAAYTLTFTATPRGSTQTLHVLGSSQAPATCVVGQHDICMERIQFTVNAGTASVTGLKVKGTGSLPSHEVLLRVYEDDGGGTFSANADTDITPALAVFDASTYTWTYNFAVPLSVIPSNPVHLFLVLSVSDSTITLGRTMRLSLQDAACVTVSPPEVAKTGTFPTQSATLTVGPSLSVAGTSLAPPAATHGQAGIPMGRLRLTANGSASVTGLQVKDVGTIPSDQVALAVYQDANGNGTLEPAADADITPTAPSYVASAKLWDYTFTSPVAVSADAPTDLFLVLSVGSSSATAGKTVQLQIGGESYVEVASPTTVSAAGFPINFPPTPMSVDPSQPDLIIQSVTPTRTTVAVNQTFNVSIVVKNQGLVASGDHYVDVFYDRATAPVAGASGDAGHALLRSVAAGGTRGIVFGSLRYTRPGTYRLWASADMSTQQVLESNEGNNYGPSSGQAMTATAVTVTGTSLAPANGRYNQRNIPMERLRFSINSGSASLTALKVRDIGTIPSDQIALAVYRDTSRDGAFDALRDTSVTPASPSFDAGTKTWTFGLTTPLLVSESRPLDLFLLVTTGSSTTAIGKTVQLTLADTSCVTLASPACLSDAGFPITSAPMTVLETVPTLNMLGSNEAPATCTRGQERIAMERLHFAVNTGTVAITGLKVRDIGTISSYQVVLRVYDDTDGDGSFGAKDTDVTPVSVPFDRTTKTWTFTFASPLTVIPSKPVHLFLVANVGPNTTAIGKTVRISLLGTGWVALSPADTALTGTFPIQSGTMAVGAGPTWTLNYTVGASGRDYGTAEFRCEVTVDGAKFSAGKTVAWSAAKSATATFAYPGDFAGAPAILPGKQYAAHAYWNYNGERNPADTLFFLGERGTLTANPAD